MAVAPLQVSIKPAPLIRFRRQVIPLVMGLSLLAPAELVLQQHGAQAAPRVPASAGLTAQSFVAKAVARSGPAVVTLETQRTV